MGFDDLRVFYYLLVLSYRHLYVYLTGINVKAVRN